jgi:FdhE protein
VPSAAEPLRFAAGLYRVQGAAAAELAGRSLTGRLDDDLAALRGGMKKILAYIAAKGPGALAAAAKGRNPDEGLEAFWRGGRSGATDYLARARLRPYAAVLAASQVKPEPGATAGNGLDGRCDFCGGLAWIAARRPTPGGAESATRYLGCALCGTEQPVARIACPSCGEEKPEALPNFQSEKHPGVRVEACATCRRYVKSLDLTVDGRLIPEVDDLASLALDLWAVEQGYARIEPGLAGI